MAASSSGSDIAEQLKIHVWCQTDVGLRRERNEDSFLIDEDLGLYVVADGMGGHRGGEVASKLAVETMRSHLQTAVNDSGARRVTPRQVLITGCEDASHQIYMKSQENGGELQGMGTTLVAALIRRNTIYIANVGDSRAYLFKNDQLWQLTEDHSLMNEQLRAGLLQESDIERFTAKNVITRSVGFESEVQVDVVEREVEPGEIYVVCSDGLHGMVDDKKIDEICRSSVKQGKPSEIVPKCISEAKQNGGDDNVTVLVIYAQSQPG